MTCFPVRLPLASYVARGSSAFPLDHAAYSSRDFSLRAARLLAVVVVTCTTGCTILREPSEPHFIVLTTPANSGLFVLVGLVLVVLAFLAGFVLGLRSATRILRAADAAARQYHRAEVAEILDASSTVHELVGRIVRHAHHRIAELRAHLRRLEGAQR